MMPSLYTTIGPWTFQTFNLFLTLAALVSAGVALRRIHKTLTPWPTGSDTSPSWRGANASSAADAYLGTLAGAVIGARLFHVLLNWDYFAENLNEASMVSLGGLDWHGGVLGGLIGLYGAWWLRQWLARRRGLSPTNAYRYADLLDSLTPALPLIGMAAWWGCLAASCGYGAEVDNLSNYPAFVVSETADVYGIAAPRYNTQVFGLILSAGVLVVVMILFWRGKPSPPSPLPQGEGRRRWRFWFVLALLSAGMFVIGFYRGDSSIYVANLRADQILDLVFVVGSIVAISRQRNLR